MTWLKKVGLFLGNASLSLITSIFSGILIVVCVLLFLPAAIGIATFFMIVAVVVIGICAVLYFSAFITGAALSLLTSKKFQDKQVAITRLILGSSFIKDVAKDISKWRLDFVLRGFPIGSVVVITIFFTLLFLRVIT